MNSCTIRSCHAYEINVYPSKWVSGADVTVSIQEAVLKNKNCTSLMQPGPSACWGGAEGAPANPVPLRYSVKLLTIKWFSFL